MLHSQATYQPKSMPLLNTKTTVEEELVEAKSILSKEFSSFRSQTRSYYISIKYIILYGDRKIEQLIQTIQIYKSLLEPKISLEYQLYFVHHL